MLILKNVTAVQLHPAKVQEGVDIAIENDVIVAIDDARNATLSRCQLQRDASSDCDAGNCLLAQPFLLGAFPRNYGKHRPLPGFHLNAEKSLVAAGSRP